MQSKIYPYFMQKVSLDTLKTAKNVLLSSGYFFKETKSRHFSIKQTLFFLSFSQTFFHHLCPSTTSNNSLPYYLHSIFPGSDSPLLWYPGKGAVLFTIINQIFWKVVMWQSWKVLIINIHLNACSQRLIFEINSGHL